MAGLPFFQNVYSLLLSLSVVASLSCFVLAAIQLRAEGGVNYDANGGFFKWLFWGAVMLTLPSISLWLSSEGIQASVVTAGGSGGTAGYVAMISRPISDFTYNYLVPHIVPVLAAALVFKAVLDGAEGLSPLPSIIAALFLLSIQGFFTVAMSWGNNADPYGTASLLMSMFQYAAYTLSPLIGALCIVGAIINYIRGAGWGHLVFSGLGFLSLTGLWALVQVFAGVSVR
jgi:hypothetical protein